MAAIAPCWVEIHAFLRTLPPNVSVSIHDMFNPIMGSIVLSWAPDCHIEILHEGHAYIVKFPRAITPPAGINVTPSQFIEYPAECWQLTTGQPEVVNWLLHTLLSQQQLAMGSARVMRKRGKVADDEDDERAASMQRTYAMFARAYANARVFPE
jgi:hypothetical protein